MTIFLISNQVVPLWFKKRIQNGSRAYIWDVVRPLAGHVIQLLSLRSCNLMKVYSPDLYGRKT